MRTRSRAGGSFWLGPIRIGVSAPVNGRGRVRVSEGTRLGRNGWFSLSQCLGGGKRGRKR